MLLKGLTTLTASLASGTLFHVEKSGKAYNIDYTKLAKAIVEEYNGSTLGGSAQTVQAAIGALNSSSGVQTLTLSEATAGVNASFYYKVGHVVTVFIDCTPSTGGTAVTVATLPSGYRPPATIRSPLTPVVRDSTLTDIGTAFGVIDSQGRIQFYMGSARRIFFTLTYSVV